MQKICYIFREKFETKNVKDKKYCKVRDHYHYTEKFRGAAYSTFKLKYSVAKKISIAFPNGPSYDYYFIIKELAEEFLKKITCLGENTEEYIIFAVPIENEVAKIDKNGEITKNIYNILRFIDSARFMASSFLNFVNNLSEGIHKIKCKYGNNDKKCETYRIEYK